MAAARVSPGADAAASAAGPTAFNRATHVAVRLVSRPFWGPDVEGLGRVPRRGRLLVACNHRHWTDTLLLPLVVQRVRYIQFLGKEELFRNPLSAWVMKELGVIPLDRRKGDVGALKAAMNVLESEGCLGLFPEGTRSRTGQPLKPKPGIAFLAHRSGASVLPARVRNTERFPSPVRMSIRFGDPMRYEGDGSRESCQLFAEKVMEAIYKL